MAGPAADAGAGDTVALCLDNVVGELPRIDAALDRLQADHGLGDDLIYALRQCAHEAFSNIVAHAYDDDGRHRIDLRLAVAADRIVLELRDDGRPFDPSSAAATAPPRSLDEANLGGLGLGLLHHFADTIGYARKSGLNHLTLQFFHRAGRRVPPAG